MSRKHSILWIVLIAAAAVALTALAHGNDIFLALIRFLSTVAVILIIARARKQEK